jgi:hypothetical protein
MLLAQINVSLMHHLMFLSAEFSETGHLNKTSSLQFFYHLLLDVIIYLGVVVPTSKEALRGDCIYIPLPGGDESKNVFPFFL